MSDFCTIENKKCTGGGVDPSVIDELLYELNAIKEQTRSNTNAIRIINEEIAGLSANGLKATICILNYKSYTAGEKKGISIYRNGEPLDDRIIGEPITPTSEIVITMPIMLDSTNEKTKLFSDSNYDLTNFFSSDIEKLTSGDINATLISSVTYSYSDNLMFLPAVLVLHKN